MANPILYNGVASPQSIFDEYGVSHSDQDQGPVGYHPVGTRAYLPDGRVFYYTSNSNVALTAGALLVVPVTTGLNITATDNDITVTDSSANFAVGAKKGIVLQESDVDTNDIIQNAYAEGYLYTEDGTGEGHTYKIRRHSAFDASGSSTSKTIDLYDPIKVALAATSQISFAKNPYSRVITATTAEEEAPLGVAPIAVTASGAAPTDVTAASNTITTYFFWAQTWGPCAVEVDDTSVASGIKVMSANTADRVEQYAIVAGTGATPPITGDERPDVGVGLVSAAAATGDFVLVDLRIRP